MDLNELGWNQSWQKDFDALGDTSLVPARVVREDKEACLIVSEHGESTARLSGRMLHEASSRADLPTVGDWVAVRLFSDGKEGIIHNVLLRKGGFSRNAAGSRTEEQILAANVDTAFLVTGLDGNFNLRRIERYVTLAWDSGTGPVIVLNKADLCDELEVRVREVEAIAIGVPVLAMSATENHGIDALRKHIATGRTVVFLGSSGVGKSTIVNRLLGEERQKVDSISGAVGKGRHTTTRRELILLPGGGLVIDTPGMRELQVWGDGEGVKKTFDDVIEIARSCRFRDCTHNTEPGCAVREALDSGSLDPARYTNYLKLQKEFSFLARREDHRARVAEKNRWKRIVREVRQKQKRRGKEW